MTWVDWILLIALVTTNLIWYHLLRLASKQLKFLSKLILLERKNKTPITTPED
jgi:hypothetical protein